MNILTPYREPSGYLGIRLHTGPRRYSVRVHVLVARAFIGERPTGHHINHINSNKADNRADNLEYITPLGNSHHCHSTGHGRRGINHQNSKLTEHDVRDMRKLRAEGWTLSRLSEKFGVTYANCGYICRRKTWAHI